MHRHDDGELKYEALVLLCSSFRAKHGRDPTFWLDKVCIDQDNIADGLKVLPINVMACKKMLVLCGPTYPTRLWCAWELCTLFSFKQEEAALATVVLVPLEAGESADGANGTLGRNVIRELRHFRCASGPRQQLDLGRSGTHLPPLSPFVSTAPSTLPLTTPLTRRLAPAANLSVSKSHCYDPNEEARLRKVIRAVGEDTFNTKIRNLALAYEAEQRAG
jgi:hypothetical protein